MNNLRALIAAAVLGAVSLPASTAVAQAPSPEVEAKARALFNAGVDDYKQKRYLAAAQSFVGAHEMVPNSSLLFSAAQAFRRAFEEDQQEQSLAMAARYYRRYLDEVSEGKKRMQAAKALGELKPYLEGLEVDETQEMKFPTRVNVRSSVPGAVVELDGGPAQALPFSQKIEPGKHRFVAYARGYEPEVREFEAKPEETVPHDISFTPVAPLFDVVGEDGAEVEVDGQLLGEVPFGKPLAVAAGRHFVTVTERGRLTYATEVDFENGTQNELTVDLPETTQRKLSYGVMATGGAGVLAAGVFVGLALAEESTAKSIDSDRQAGPISVDDQLTHNDAINQRNDYVLAAGVTAGISGAVLVTGLFLFLFDEPEVPSVVTRGGDDDDSPTPSEDDAPVEIEMMGTLAPGNYGFGLRGTF